MDDDFFDNYWTVHVDGVRFGDNDAHAYKLDTIKAIIDSGTSYTYIPN